MTTGKNGWVWNNRTYLEVTTWKRNAGKWLSFQVGKGQHIRQKSEGPNAYSGEGNGNPLQYSCLENPMDREAWWAVVHGVAKSRTRLSDFAFTFHFHALEKEMATHQCSCLENPRDRGAWWAAIYGVAQSRTGLKRLSSSSSSSSSDWLGPILT